MPAVVRVPGGSPFKILVGNLAHACANACRLCVATVGIVLSNLFGHWELVDDNVERRVPYLKFLLKIVLFGNGDVGKGVLFMVIILQGGPGWPRR